MILRSIPRTAAAGEALCGINIMTMTQIIFDIIICGCLIYLIFFKEYIKRKGSNLADKEDIAEITNKIEQVKKEFTQENELLKANLQFIINNQLQLSNEERNAIIGFYDYFSKWLNVGLLDLNVHKYHPNNIEDLIQKDRTLDEYFTQTNVAQNRISLLVSNKEIIRLSNELISATLKFNHWTQAILLDLRFNLQRHKSQLDIFLKIIEMKPIPAEASEIAAKEEILLAERKEICDRFFKEKLEEYKNVLKICQQFTELVKDYLNQIRKN